MKRISTIALNMVILARYIESCGSNVHAADIVTAYQEMEP